MVTYHVHQTNNIPILDTVFLLEYLLIFVLFGLKENMLINLAFLASYIPLFMS